MHRNPRQRARNIITHTRFPFASAARSQEISWLLYVFPLPLAIKTFCTFAGAVILPRTLKEECFVQSFSVSFPQACYCLTYGLDLRCKLSRVSTQAIPKIPLSCPRYAAAHRLRRRGQREPIVLNYILKGGALSSKSLPIYNLRLRYAFLPTVNIGEGPKFSSREPL